uniref:Uncharacterized protein n=1 Tax=Rhodopseudomonas palustris (strain DX-1) TaxID=652103 RepID=E6VL66_RHOPX
MMQLLVTLLVAGQPVMRERLPTVYSATDNKCQAAADVLIKRAVDGAEVSIECVPAHRSV